MDHVENNRKMASMPPDSSMKSRDVMPADYIDSLIFSLDHNTSHPPVAQGGKPLPLDDGGLILFAMAAPPRSETDDGMVVPTLTRLLGFPLMVHPIGSILQPVDNIYNERAHLLFLDVDISKKTFGTFSIPPVMGNLTVERCDRKNLKGPQLVSLITYIDAQVGAALRQWSSGSLHQKAATMARLSNIIKPRAFYEYFECHRGMPEFEEWNGVENPAQITEEEKKKPICSACFAMDREDGKPLLRCGACGKVAYCSKECQKVDWRAWHKKVCKKAGQ